MASFKFFRRLLGETDRREHRRVQAPGGTRMLVVDDSPTIRAVLAKMLIQDGYVVLKAGDGESALEVACREQPDLIFLDIVLPRMNGFAVLRALRRDERTRGIPIVMISGNLQATEQFYVQRFGADDFMKKPFGRAEVFSRIQQLVESGRLPARTATVDETAIAELENMAHIPDVALPDEDLPEHERAAHTSHEGVALFSPHSVLNDQELAAPASPQLHENEVRHEPAGAMASPVADDRPGPETPDLLQVADSSDNEASAPAGGASDPEPTAPPVTGAGDETSAMGDPDAISEPTVTAPVAVAASDRPEAVQARLWDDPDDEDHAESV